MGYLAAFKAASTAVSLASNLGLPVDVIFGDFFGDDATTEQLNAIEAKLDALQASVTSGFASVTNATFTSALSAANTPTIVALGTLRNPTAPAADRDLALESANLGLVGTTNAINNMFNNNGIPVSRDAIELAFDSLSLSLSVMINTANAFNSGGVTEDGNHNHGGLLRYSNAIDGGIAALQRIETEIRNKYTVETVLLDTVFVDEGTNEFFDEEPTILLNGTYHTRARLLVTTDFETTFNPLTALNELDNPGDDFRIKLYVEEFFGESVQIIPQPSGNDFILILPEVFGRFRRDIDLTSVPPSGGDFPLPSREFDDPAVLAEYISKIAEINAHTEDFLYNALTDFKVSAVNPPDLSFYETDADGIGSLVKDIQATVSGINEANTGLEEGKLLSGTAFDDFLTGTSVGDVLVGLAGNDYLLGNAGDDVMRGGEGSDHYFVGDGNDIVEDDGVGASADVAVFAGNRTDGSFKIVDGLLNVLRTNSVSGEIDTNVLSGIEFLKFDDGTNEIEAILKLEDLIIEGTQGADTITGRVNNDTLFGLGGNDLLVSAGGADRMEGGTGSDIYEVNNEDDEVIEEANAGIDTVRSSVVSYTLTANVENLVLTLLAPGTFGGIPVQTGRGNDLDNVIEGNESQNTLGPGFEIVDGEFLALGGNNTLRGFGGEDELQSGKGDDVLDGGEGRDTVSYIFATSGVDIDLRNSVQENTGGLGIDTLIDIEQVSGSFHNDRLVIDAEIFVDISGFSGDDIIRNLGDAGAFIDGGAGNDRLFGGKGDEVILGGQGDDVQKGRGGNDRFEEFNFDSGNDQMFGGNGADFLDAGNGDDLLHGGNGSDQLFGGDGADKLVGGKGKDTLNGGDKADILKGGIGLDILDGGQGRDILNGGKGNDVLIGGAGNDVFVFQNNAGQDQINDFDATKNGEDINLQAVTEIIGFKDLKNNHMSQVGDDVIIDDNNGTQITLLDVLLSDLGRGDFLF